MRKAAPPSTTVGKILEFLVPKKQLRNLTDWPPDVFAVSAYLLKITGAYRRAVMKWPPKGSHEKWVSDTKKLGRNWRRQSTNVQAAPEKIAAWWGEVLKAKSKSLAKVAEGELNDALLNLLAASDEASAGAGVLNDPGDGKTDEFQYESCRYLMAFGTLCKKVGTDTIRVLPKQHTPQTGTTLRSLSHHLALCPSGEVGVNWGLQMSPFSRDNVAAVNILIVPWPEVMPADAFSQLSKETWNLHGMAKDFGFFAYDVTTSDKFPMEKFLKVLEEAKKQVGRIDGVIFPELSMDEPLFQEIAHLTIAALGRPFVTAGIGTSHPDTYGKNELIYWMPWYFPDGRNETARYTEFRQNKHHRWKLNESQVRQYALTHRLDPYRDHWEHSEIGHRAVNFFSSGSSMTFCFLICEDLARQDPVGDIVRSVGPNLVIALLMDGPQITSRWGGRYATVLAEDPGSSVLTVSCLGMTSRTIPPPNAKDSRRTIALWKDASGGATEIALADDASAVVLTINRQFRTELSADGRDDGNAAASYTLGDTHQIRV